LKGQNKVRESKQPQDCNENRTDPTATNITVRLAKLHAYAEASKLTAQITRTYKIPTTANDRKSRFR